jgi:hypothetical protein
MEPLRAGHDVRGIPYGRDFQYSDAPGAGQGEIPRAGRCERDRESRRERGPVEGFLEPAGTEKRDDLERFAGDRRADRRGVENRDAMDGAEPRERRPELQHFIDRFEAGLTPICGRDNVRA